MNTFLETLHTALRPRKAQTVAEIVKAIKFERSRRDVALALVELERQGLAQHVIEEEAGASMVLWIRGKVMTTDTKEKCNAK